MAIPKHTELQKPFLVLLKDGKVYAKKDIIDMLSQQLNLSESELRELLPSGKQTVFRNRVSWAGTYLMKAGLITRPAHGKYQITPQGLNVLRENPDIIDNAYLMRFESFRIFQQVSHSPVENSSQLADKAPIIDEKTPDVLLAESWETINASLADDLLEELIRLSPTAFEHLVTDLLCKMYGVHKKAGTVTPPSSDGGIDGIVMADRLGLQTIYMQAKKWQADHTVSTPDVQAFAGAILPKSGQGVFVTTSRFSQGAIDYAARSHIVLIDGKLLAELMIEYDFCVSTRRIYAIKAVDTDALQEYQDM